MSATASAEATPAVAGGRRALGLAALTLVVLLVSGVALLLLPRPNGVPVEGVDVAAAAARDRAELGFAPTVPAGLGAGWVVRGTDVQRGTDGRPTWHLTYVTPSGEVAGLQQTVEATPAWESRQVTDGRDVGTRLVAGVAWVVRSREDRGIISLVRRPEPGDRAGATTVVSTSGSQAEADELATAVVRAQGG
ncbi:DUF4245 family protein [Spongisporangium articulatum]|uniref:DUF4245 family protein n=1 Tax=Spongisporangium articulatum TaxID=3362603 RepID=A0ABW8ASK6_9ACTN